MSSDPVWFGVRCEDGAAWLVAAFPPRPGHFAIVEGPPWKAVVPDEMESEPGRPRVATHTGWNARAAVASLAGDMAWPVVEIVALEGSL